MIFGGEGGGRGRERGGGGVGEEGGERRGIEMSGVGKKRGNGNLDERMGNTYLQMASIPIKCLFHSSLFTPHQNIRKQKKVSFLNLLFRINLTQSPISNKNSPLK